ncbi:hypothetical protein Ahy_A05g022224 isoform B [Arachis hypogaea]|uniref:Uncharacterized protein n=1 Tax=Arachis hypogaea TaxID=3818 RepID=A0A445CZX0_ARAHY|nr:hypothetical protein Ahy_A05g022224 isoform B [Arachis hypogaea]
MMILSTLRLESRFCC